MKREEQNQYSDTPRIQFCEENGGPVGNGREISHTKKEIVEEVKKQLWLAGPLVSVSILVYSLQMISVMFVGHLGELPLSGASVATSFAIVTGFSLLMGLSTALETLSGQAYGAKQYDMMGIHMQRAMVVLLLVSIPLAIIWANTRSILILLRQDAAIAAEAGQYVRFMIPSVFAYGFSKASLRNIPTFLKLSIPSAVMVCLEMWSFEMLVILAGLLPNPKLETSVLSISLNTAGTVWMISFGLGAAVSTRVSNELGAGHPKAARLAKIGAYVNLGSYYLIGIQSAILFAFVFHIGGKAKKARERIHDSKVLVEVSGSVTLAHSKSKYRKMERNQEQMPYSNTPQVQVGEENGGANGRDEKKDRRSKIIMEVKKQLWLAGPLIAVNMLLFCLQVISVMFVGHLGELSLSGASVGTSFAAVTGFSLLMGLSTALETLSGQAYGAKQYDMMGIYMQRAMFILLLVCIPLAIIWANTRSILTLLGQNAAIAAEAGQYALFMIPSIFAYALLQCFIRFLQTQNIVFPMVLSCGITTLLHVFMCWILVFKSGLGNRGAALANSISYWINVLLLGLYVKFSSSCAKTWTGFSKESFRSIPAFLKLAIPSAVMICKVLPLHANAAYNVVFATLIYSLEMWSFEMLVLLSGLLPNPKLETSVLSISLNTVGTVWMIPSGLSAAVSTRVSNELGAGNPKAARLSVLVVLVLAITEGLFVASILIMIRNFWGYAYSKETEVVKYVSKLMPILAVLCFIDGLQSVLSELPADMDSKKEEVADNKTHHILCIPWPVQSHIKVMLKLAKLLHSRGFHITFVNTEYNHKRFLMSLGPDSLQGLPDFRFEIIPDGLLPSDADATQDLMSLVEALMEKMLAPFCDLLKRLNDMTRTCNDSPPPVTRIVSDGFLPFTIAAGRELGIPVVFFYTISACSFMVFKQLGSTADHFVFNFCIEETEKAHQASAIIIHTFNALEQDVLDAISSMFPKVFAIGPLQLLLNRIPEHPLKLKYSLWKEESECLQWLNTKPKGSVLYVNFGSIAVMSPQQFAEFGYGIANSKHPFLWIIRPDLDQPQELS
ncbi:hypothetical protein FEM48_Zijuj05G0096200 [Ziziphus jujuba var. spinosa]|uniref:Protein DETOXIFICATION n=1 Tax=Ziziphus jujuba var. spinosa TaxID=714518 RepID=A0A978VE76_ZIZJJ|nr:hypothetical protein FEM48_Zijuj05G0096200 [Ziziphus jujuba var. spinosa]